MSEEQDEGALDEGVSQDETAPEPSPEPSPEAPEAPVAGEDTAADVQDEDGAGSESVRPAAMADLDHEQGDETGAKDHPSLDMVMNIPVTLTVELGRKRLSMRQLLQLAQNSVIDLDKSEGESLNLLVNNLPIAQGEVVVLNERQYGLRLTKIIKRNERLQAASSSF